jgi:phenylacetate-CoA ligase
VEQQRQRVISAYEEFLDRSLDEALDPQQQERPQEQALALFRHVAATVPAYRALLAEHGIVPETIKTEADFEKLPHLTKQNYLLRYPLPDLCREGRLETCDMVAASSGSTGKPTYWPRFLTDELRIARRFEQVFHDSFHADERRTLAVICFTLGTWVGGMYTASCCRHLAAKGYPITVVTPGNNKEEIYRAVQELGQHMDQVVLLGYPPFLKDVIDTGRMRGIDWPRYRIKLVMAGEVFSEEWRALVGQRIGSTDLNCDSATLYGTADAGVLGNETPLSIRIRRWLAEHPAAARQLFGESRLPTLVQYDPLSRYFEAQDGALLFTGDNGIPLIRYNILDTGGIVPYAEMLTFLADSRFDPIAELKQSGTRGVRALPFVFVFGRSDFTASYFGANIYPENVTVGLEQPEIKEWVTGKFVLQVTEDADHNRFLAVAVELAPGINGDGEKEKALTESILAALLRLNSEFANYVPMEYRTLRVSLKPAGDPDYFPLGVKHRYTRSEKRSLFL